MFNILAKLLSTIATFLFPVFASYKALKTSDPALLTPWLMYWVVLACALLFESWAEFILVWVPFYPWIRAIFLLYLIAPQTQGARLIYQQHVHPFLHEHELLIDDFISSAHDRAKTAGLSYLKQLIELIKEHVLGLPPQQPQSPPPQTTLSYTQSLLARFNLPSVTAAAPSSYSFPARSAATSTATDFYTLLASAVSAATAGASSQFASNNNNAGQSGIQDLSNSGTLIPPTISGADRLSFIATQRERLSTLMSALDREALNLNANADSGKRVPSMSYDGHQDGETEQRPQSAMSGLSKSRSEVDFEKIERDVDAEENVNQSPRFQRQSSGSWLPWSWGGKPVPTGAEEDARDGKDTDVFMGGADAGKSSGVDI